MTSSSVPSSSSHTRKTFILCISIAYKNSCARNTR